MKKTATTRLGRAVRESVKADKRTRGQVLDHHSTTNSLRDVILGGQDGLVNMLGIALGVVAAGGSTHVLVVIGVVIGLAGAFGVSRVLSQILYGIKATDPMTYILMSFVIEAGGRAYLRFRNIQSTQES